MRRTLGLLLVLAALLLPAAPARADSAPFSDLQSVGGLALCNSRGQAIEAGSIHDRPFAWTAVSSVAAPTPYGGPGRSATLFAYQPRRDAYPDQWNGDSLTAASEYPAGKHPATAGTQVDGPLSDFLTAFPARWDGLVELRLYWGARSVGFDAHRFVSAVIKVQGSRWHAVSGLRSGCGSSAAVSTEITVAGIDTTPTPAAVPGRATPAPTASTGATGSVAGAASLSPASRDVLPQANAKASSAASWSKAFGWVLAALLGLTLALLVLRVLRLRHPTTDRKAPS